MASPRLALLLAVLVPLAAVAGCLGGEEPPAEPTVDAAAENDTTPDAALPDGRGEAIAFEETNKTEEGVGGVEHKHDYWGGAETLVVFQDDVFFNVFPMYPEGQEGGAKSVAYVKLGQPNLVYEGATEVEVLVQAPTIPLAEGASVPDPAPVSAKLSYRTAASEDFLDAGPITYGSPIVLPVSAQETDMPHSVSSLWAFALTTDRVDYVTTVNVTITAKKGGAVLDWPGHPDFYADGKTSRVVFDDTVTVHRSGIEEAVLYGTASSWIAPEKLISHGTGHVDVFVNVTSAAASNGAQPTGFFLEYHDATILDAEDAYNDRIDDEEGGRAFADPSYHFRVPVTPDGMDGPYQPSSRWGFRLVATFAETPVASLCPGCFPYDITYDMQIVAHKGDDAGMTM